MFWQLLEGNHYRIIEGILYKSGCFSDKAIKLFKISEENNNIEELSYSPLEGHSYSINHIEFSRDCTMLASCSLDGGTIIWNPTVSVTH